MQEPAEGFCRITAVIDCCPSCPAYALRRFKIWAFGKGCIPLGNFVYQVRQFFATNHPPSSYTRLV
ncbi:hypothetical protein RvY_06699 [Ramazzottius varieornatus]|uniref:Uncharacterized protein n=1 Tax=Ramazzottius varieornatus TaxID=947166 RepID=A0A1D1V2C6_RAMVA|nr:hypothetical protein RvY_06699 [Ramazzottius varieornatus]